MMKEKEGDDDLNSEGELLRQLDTSFLNTHVVIRVAQ